jgi:hypothetical protein
LVQNRTKEAPQSVSTYNISQQGAEGVRESLHRLLRGEIVQLGLLAREQSIHHSLESHELAPVDAHTVYILPGFVAPVSNFQG